MKKNPRRGSLTARILCLLCCAALAGCAPAEAPASESGPAETRESVSAPQTESEPVKENEAQSAAPREESEEAAASDADEPKEAPLSQEESAPPAEPAETSVQSENTDAEESAPPVETGASDGNFVRATSLTVRAVSAPGTDCYANGSASIDYSNADQGYVMIAYTGSSSKVRLQLTGPDQITYTYVLTRGGYGAYPLTGGSGSYTANVFECVSGSQYALAAGTTFSAKLQSSLLPYLYPNVYVSFTSGSTAVQKGETLASTAATELDVVANVYHYAVQNIRYDDAKAASVTTGYVPSPDSTLAEGKGICFDYAALMAAMLRTQNIPTRLEVGYAGSIYHAWISVYLQETGWIDGIIYFDGTHWRLMDPTFASSGGSDESVKKFITNDANYSVKYLY